MSESNDPASDLARCDPQALAAVAKLVRVIAGSPAFQPEQLADPRSTHRVAHTLGRISVADDIDSVIARQRQGA